MNKEKLFYIFEGVIGVILSIAVITLASVLHAWSIWAVIVLVIDIILALRGFYDLYIFKRIQGN